MDYPDFYDLFLITHSFLHTNILNSMFLGEGKRKPSPCINDWAILDALSPKMSIMHVLVEIKTRRLAMSTINLESGSPCTTLIPVNSADCLCWNAHSVERFVSIRAIDSILLKWSEY